MADRLDLEENAHDPDCQWSTMRKPCKRFSTDGTRLGSVIAHTIGTTDEDEITRIGARFSRPERHYGSQIDGPKLTGMTEEQREWEGHDDQCESEFIQEAGMYSPCGCKERAGED